jgi:hypothetical protein
MRAAFLALCLLLLAVSAAAESSRPECKQLERRIERLEEVQARYDARGNDEFADRADDQIDRLNELRHVRGCPETIGEATARKIQELLKLAAQGAITFFTLGMGAPI